MKVVRTKIGEVRRIPIKAGSFSGTFPSRHPGAMEHDGARRAAALGYESQLELELLEQLEFQTAVVRVETQAVTLEYEWQGKVRVYSPDVLLSLDPARSGVEDVFVVEVKNRAALRRKRDELAPKFLAAKAWCRREGATFRVLAEWAIRTPYLMNARLLLPSLAFTIEDREAAFLEEHLRAGPMSISQLIERGRIDGLAEPDARQAIERGIAWRRVHADLADRIDDGSVLRLAEDPKGRHPYDLDPFLKTLTGGTARR